MAVLAREHTQNVHTAVVAWHGVTPGVAAFLAASRLINTYRIVFARLHGSFGLRARLPRWPLSPDDDGPAIVVGLSQSLSLIKLARHESRARVAALVLEVKEMCVTTVAASWPMWGVKSWTMDGDGQGAPNLTTPTKADPEIRHCSRSARRRAARRRAW